MYRIPPDLDFSFCTDSTLHQIALGKYDVQFFFDSGAKIAVQGEVVLLRNGTVLARWNEGTGWSSLAFQGLLNQSVQSGRVLNERVIELEFAEGSVLQLHDSSDQYESMQIYSSADGSPIIVI